MANEEKNLVPHQYTSSQSREEAAKNGRKGGIASGIARRKKCASRKFLKEVLAMEPKKTKAIMRLMEEVGADPDAPITVEQVGVLAVLRKYQSGDLRAYDLIHEYLGEDPHTMLEKERLKIQKDAVNAIRNTDGFMEAMGAAVGEVFEDGGDTPDALEDSD